MTLEGINWLVALELRRLIRNVKANKKKRVSDSPKVFTYAESGVPYFEAAPRARLLFAASCFDGPNFQEKLLYFVWPSKCKSYDVLWLDFPGITAVAWLSKGELTGRKLWETLLTECWKAEKKVGWNHSKPFFDEVSFDKRSLLSYEQVWAIADRIWPRQESHPN